MTFTDGTHSMIKGKPGKKLINKSCPRCYGSMSLEFDYEVGHHKSCLNCGYIEYLHKPFLSWK